jgi:DNA-binding LacI/PurR family transcriptional regulator
MPDQQDAPLRTLPAKRLTLLDVARALNVSRTSVSNAFNRPHQLSKALHDQIIGKARELGYFGPDPAARAMRKTGVHEVAVVFHHDLRFALQDPTGVSFLRGVAAELDRRQLTLQMIPKMGRRLDLGAAFHTTADAMIVYAEIDPDLAEEVRAARKPLVLVDTLVSGVVSINSQDRLGAELAMAHTLAARPDRVLVLCFPLNQAERERMLTQARPAASAYIAGERLAGYAAAARQAGFEPERITWLQVDDRQPESAAEAVAQARARLQPQERVAIVAMSDRMALAAMAEVRRWPAPEVVALVGFDDIEAAASAGLTTIWQNQQLKGERAVQALLDGIKPRPLPVQLIVRKT